MWILEPGACSFGLSNVVEPLGMSKNRAACIWMKYIIKRQVSIDSTRLSSKRQSLPHHQQITELTSCLLTLHRHTGLTHGHYGSSLWDNSDTRARGRHKQAPGLLFLDKFSAGSFPRSSHKMVDTQMGQHVRGEDVATW